MTLPGKAWQRLGHRGLFLLLLGAMQAGYGAGLLTAAGTPPARLHWWPASTGGLGGFPLGMWGIIWCLAGGICLVSAWSSADRIAYAASVLLTTGWAAFAAYRWLTSSEPGSWAVAVIYAGIAGGTFIVSGWPETTTVPFIPPAPPPPTQNEINDLAEITRPEPPP